ncbi:hypothetical protein [Pedobacter sp. MW01-1-1]|uniref:hypothetical protein n=1 Tax=Pedobacter sp. MW01-1-1 TaxID=3383027 RepID=UPI003FEEA3D4
MKTIYLLLLIVSLSSCKKITIDDEEKTFLYDAPVSNENPIMWGGMYVTLKPGGRAGLLLGGDVIYDGTYTIKNGEVKVTIGKEIHSFKILSQTEIKYQTGHILKLVQK